MREPTWVRLSRAAVTIVAAALLLAACSSGGGPGMASPGSTNSTRSTSGSGARSHGGSATTSSVTISNFMFMPMRATVAPGSTVTVTNNDSVTHTLTATGGAFTTGDIGAGQTTTFTAPTKPGSYRYICNIHQYMTGTIVVR